MGLFCRIVFPASLRGREGLEAHHAKPPPNAALAPKIELGSNTFGCGVLRMDQRDEALTPQGRHRMVPDRPPRLGGEPLPPGRGRDDVDEFDLDPARDLLVEQPAMPDQTAARLFDGRPEIEGRRRWQCQILAQRPADRIEPPRTPEIGGRDRIAPEGGERLDVARIEGTGDQPRGLDDRSSHAPALPMRALTA